MLKIYPLLFLISSPCFVLFGAHKIFILDICFLAASFPNEENCCCIDFETKIFMPKWFSDLKERKKLHWTFTCWCCCATKKQTRQKHHKIKIASCSRAGCRLSRVKGRREHKKRLLHAPSFYKSPATCVPLVRRKKTQVAAHTHARNKRARRSHRQACVCASWLFYSSACECVHPRESKHRFIHVLCGVGQKYSNAAAATRSRSLCRLTSSFFSSAFCSEPRT